MIVYEVTASVEQELCQEYERYMQERHIPDLVATGSFTTVSFERSTDGRYRVRYHSPTRELLDAYFAGHAPKLRREFSEHFPNGVELSREEWEVVSSFA